jgi:hypothetical protein
VAQRKRENCVADSRVEKSSPSLPRMNHAQAT